MCCDGAIYLRKCPSSRERSSPSIYHEKVYSTKTAEVWWMILNWKRSPTTPSRMSWDNWHLLFWWPTIFLRTSPNNCRMCTRGVANLKSPSVKWRTRFSNAIPKGLQFVSTNYFSCNFRLADRGMTLNRTYR